MFKARGRERERDGENHQCVVASHMPPTGDLACNPGMCPDCELNPQPFGSQAVIILEILLFSTAKKKKPSIKKFSQVQWVAHTWNRFGDHHFGSEVYLPLTEGLCHHMVDKQAWRELKSVKQKVTERYCWRGRRGGRESSFVCLFIFDSLLTL